GRRPRHRRGGRGRGRLCSSPEPRFDHHRPGGGRSRRHRHRRQRVQLALHAAQRHRQPLGLGRPLRRGLGDPSQPGPVPGSCRRLGLLVRGAGARTRPAARPLPGAGRLLHRLGPELRFRTGLRRRTPRGAPPDPRPAQGQLPRRAPWRQRSDHVGRGRVHSTSGCAPPAGQGQPPRPRWRHPGRVGGSGRRGHRPLVAPPEGASHRGPGHTDHRGLPRSCRCVVSLRPVRRNGARRRACAGRSSPDAADQRGTHPRAVVHGAGTRGQRPDQHPCAGGGHLAPGDAGGHRDHRRAHLHRL
ncbi:MAG: hypothetical protein AVDCRST_MAG76-1780, partial [uncultured Acidimicrobiales bacterium]